jgi:hypothetical protein
VDIVLRNNRIAPWPGQPLRTIAMTHAMSKANSQTDDRYGVTVFDYQGHPGHNFRVYFGIQDTQGLYGGRATCNDTTTRPEIQGITCSLPASPSTPQQ